MFLGYLDPGSGSYILQFLIAGLLGLAFVFKSFWRNAASFVTNLLSGKKNESRKHEK